MLSTLQNSLPQAPGQAAGPPLWTLAAAGSVPGGSVLEHLLSGPAGCLPGPRACWDSADGFQEAIW